MSMSFSKSFIYFDRFFSYHQTIFFNLSIHREYLTLWANPMGFTDCGKERVD